MISGGAGILDAASAAGQRMIAYGSAFGELDILLLLNKKQTYTNAYPPHVRVYPLFGKLSRFWKGYALGKKLMRAHSYDVITAQDTERGLVAWMLSRDFQVPWQMQIHADIFSPYFAAHSLFDRLRVRAAKFLLPRAHGIRVVSQRIKRSILALGIKGLTAPIAVLPIFLDVEKIRNAPMRTDLHKKYPGRFIILMPTRLTKEKNIRMAIAAMELLARRAPSASARPLLLVVGKGPERAALERQVARANLAAHAVFEDWTDDMPSYYKTADVYLLTSVYEGGARAPLEALAAGLPAVMTDVAPAHEEVQDGVNGIVVPVGDAVMLAQKLYELMADPARLAQLKKGAALSLQSPISLRAYLAQYKKLLTDLL